MTIKISNFLNKNININTNTKNINKKRKKVKYNNIIYNSKKECMDKNNLTRYELNKMIKNKEIVCLV